MKKIILSVLFLVIMAILIFLDMSGLFFPIRIEEKEAGPYVLVYADHIGDYKNISKIMDMIYTSLRDTEKIQTSRGMGIYFDDPKTVSADKLRSIAGSILDEKDWDKIPQLENRYKVKRIPVQRMVTAEFPFENQLSVMIGVLRVYPKLSVYMKEKGYTGKEATEIYDMPNKKILYMFPIAQ